MPIYEFRCLDCGRKFSTLVGMVAAPDDERCPQCSSDRTEKLVSRVAKFRTEEQRVDELADRIESMDDPESPAEMRSIVRELGKAMDEDVSDELEEMFEDDAPASEDLS